MTVYVDSMRAPFRSMVMCHMIAETEVELHEMADRIGVARRWYQGDHYDIALSKRALAVRYGAVEIEWRQAGIMMGCVRMGAMMPKPEFCEMFYLALRQLKRLGVAANPKP